MGGASGFSVTDGKKLFGTPKTGNCSADAFAGGPKLIAVGSCTDPNDTSMDAPESDLLQELDPATGKAKWNFQYGKGWSIRRVYSMDPLVVYATNKDKKTWNISTFTADGKLRSQVDSKSSAHRAVQRLRHRRPPAPGLLGHGRRRQHPLHRHRRQGQR